MKILLYAALAVVGYVVISILITHILNRLGRDLKQHPCTRLPKDCQYYQEPVKLPWIATTTNPMIVGLELITTPAHLLLCYLGLHVWGLAVRKGRVTIPF